MRDAPLRCMRFLLPCALPALREPPPWLCCSIFLLHCERERLTNGNCPATQPRADARRTRAQVAAKVAEEAMSQGLGGIEAPAEGMKKYIEGRMWEPSKEYLNKSRM